MRRSARHPRVLLAMTASMSAAGGETRIDGGASASAAVTPCSPCRHIPPGERGGVRPWRRERAASERNGERAEGERGPSVISRGAMRRRGIGRFGVVTPVFWSVRGRLAAGACAGVGELPTSCSVHGRLAGCGVASWHGELDWTTSRSLLLDDTCVSRAVLRTCTDWKRTRRTSSGRSAWRARWRSTMMDHSSHQEATHDEDKTRLHVAMFLHAPRAAYSKRRSRPAPPPRAGPRRWHATQRCPPTGSTRSGAR